MQIQISSAIDTNFYSVMAMTELSLPGRVVLSMIRFRSHEKGFCWPRQSKIAKWCGLSLSQAKRAIRELLNAGLIIIKKRGFARSLEYHPVMEAQNKPCRPEKPVVARQSPTLKATTAQPRPTDHPVEVVVVAQPEVRDVSIEVTSRPLKSTSELERPVQGTPVTYIKENVLIRKKQTDIQPEPKPAPTSQVPSSVSLNLSLKTFEDVKAWSGHRCLACSQEATELHPVKIDTSRKLDLADVGNLMACCKHCAETITKDYQTGLRPDHRARFATTHNLTWPSCFGPDPADKAAEEAEVLVSQLPAKARTWVMSKKDQLPFILPVIKTLLQKLHMVANPTGYLINGWRNQLEEATA
ncbi:MAG: helix-turn-helix domain-containing protein [Deltaproteobacteria bacterium]|nr:helix-turn-helix domain-containing protein [Deltaproteobacteria bacterium]